MKVSQLSKELFQVMEPLCSSYWMGKVVFKADIVVMAAAVLVSETLSMITFRGLVVIFRVSDVVLELMCIIVEDLVTIGGVMAVLPVFAAFMTDAVVVRIVLINVGLNVVAGRKVVMVLMQLLHLFN